MTLVIKILGGGGFGELPNPTGTLKKKKKTTIRRYDRLASSFSIRSTNYILIMCTIIQKEKCQIKFKWSLK